MTKLTWLHLSDWHQKGTDFDRKVVRDKLLDDICARTQHTMALDVVDFVVFSGDLACFARQEEYQAARKELLDPVLEALGLKPDRLFMVPGNHDMNRNYDDTLPPELQKPLENDSLVQKWLDDSRRNKFTLEPFDAYRTFVIAYSNQANPDYASIHRLTTTSGRSIALLGLNSAWMSARHKNAKDEVDDKGHLLVGEPQIHDALTQIADADVRIAVLHHPFEWLADFDRHRIEDRLKQECHFILHGHEHQPKVHVVGGTGGDCVVIPAGAAYERRIADHPRYVNAYNWVSLDLAAGTGIVYLRRWSELNTAWTEDNETYSNGQYPLKSLPKNLAARTISTPVAVSFPAPPDQDRLLLEGYLKALIDNHTHLEPGGIKQTSTQVVLPLDEIYVGLQADHDRPDVDRRVMQEELDEIKARLAHEENPVVREKQYQIWASQARTLQLALETKGPREELSQIVQSHRQLAILGEPGSGKTTLLRYLALQLARAVLAEPERLFQPQTMWDDKTAWYLPELGPVRLPILLRIAHYAEARQKEPDLSLLEYLPRYFCGLQVPNAECLGPLLRRMLDAGRCLVLLDGLDEIIDPADRRNIAAAIGQFANAYRETGLPSWLAQSPTGMRTVSSHSDDNNQNIIIAWHGNEPDAVRQEWELKLWQRSGRVQRMAQEALREARYAHVGNRFVVTSRIAGYHFAGVPGDFEHYTIRRMGLEDIRRFLEKWCPAVERRIADAPDTTQVERRARREIDGILHAIRTTPGVRRMAENPLLLRILAIIHRNESHLPQRRVELYETAVITLLRDWNLERGVKGAVIDDVKALSLLGPLAFHIHEHYASGFLSKGETERFLSGILAQESGESPEQPSLVTREAVREFLETVREHSGLFVERGEGLYGFMHLTFEEYFTARHLVSRSTTARTQILNHLHRPRWREPILLAIGSLSKQFYDDTRELLESIVDAGSDYETVLHRDLLFAAACVGDSVNLAPILRRKIADKLLDIYCDPHHVGRYRWLRDQCKEALLALCNDQGDALVEASLIAHIKKATGRNTLLQALDAVDWLKGRTPSLADALDTCTDFGLTQRVRELSEQVRSRVAGISPEGWLALQHDTALAWWLGALWRFGWNKALEQGLQVAEPILCAFAAESMMPIVGKLRRQIEGLISRLENVVNDEDATLDLDEECQSLFIELYNKIEQLPPSFAHEFRSKVIGIPTLMRPAKIRRLVDDIEALCSSFLPDDANFYHSDANVEVNFLRWGKAIICNAGQGNRLAPMFALHIAAMSQHNVLDEESSCTHTQALQTGLMTTLLGSMRSSKDAQYYSNAALFLLHTKVSDDAIAIVLADLTNVARRYLALSALTETEFRQRVNFNEAQYFLLLELLHASTDQASSALGIVFALDFSPALLDSCWSVLRSPDHPLAEEICAKLEGVKEIPGTQPFLALLNRGMREPECRISSLELLRKIKWQGTETFVQALTWLLDEDAELRYHAALLLAGQKDCSLVPHAIMGGAASLDEKMNNNAWRALRDDASVVRLLGGLWLQGWDNALTQLWVAQPAKFYIDEKHSNIGWYRFRTYPESEVCIRWLLERAEWGGSLIPAFKDAAKRLTELEGVVTSGEPEKEYILAAAQMLTAKLSEQLAQTDTALPALTVLLQLSSPSETLYPLIRSLTAPSNNHSLAAWLRQTLADQGLTPDAEPTALASLLANDSADIRCAAALALLAADLWDKLIAVLLEAAQAPDDNVRRKAERRLHNVCHQLPTDGRSEAIGRLLNFYQQHSEGESGYMATLALWALGNVRHDHPYWIARWLNVAEQEGTEESQAALAALKQVFDVSASVLPLLCLALNDSKHPIATRSAVARAFSTILLNNETERADTAIHTALMQALIDEDAGIRYESVYSLRWALGLGAWEVAETLLSCAEASPYPDTRILALYSLGRVLHTVRGFCEVDTSKEALFRWLKKEGETSYYYEKNVCDEIGLLSELAVLQVLPDVEAVLTALAAPDVLNLPEHLSEVLFYRYGWEELLQEAAKEWTMRRYWQDRLPQLPRLIARLETLLVTSDTEAQRAAACALARLYHGEDDRIIRLRTWLHDDTLLLRTLLDAMGGCDQWLDASDGKLGYHDWMLKQIVDWIVECPKEQTNHWIDQILSDLETVYGKNLKQNRECFIGDYSNWDVRRTLLALLAALSERLTYRAFTRNYSHEEVASLLAQAARDTLQFDIRRFAIRALGNMQLFTAPVADAFFTACQDVGLVYAETHSAVGKFKIFGPGSLEQLIEAVRNPSLTVAYHATLLLGELGLYRSEELGDDGRRRVADGLLALLDDPTTERVVYDYRKNEDGEKIGALYDVIYEALTRVVAGPDAPSQSS